MSGNSRNEPNSGTDSFNLEERLKRAASASKNHSITRPIPRDAKLESLSKLQSRLATHPLLWLGRFGVEEGYLNLRDEKGDQFPQSFKAEFFNEFDYEHNFPGGPLDKRQILYGIPVVGALESGFGAYLKIVYNTQNPKDRRDNPYATVGVATRTDNLWLMLPFIADPNAFYLCARQIFKGRSDPIKGTSLQISPNVIYQPPQLREAIEHHLVDVYQRQLKLKEDQRLDFETFDFELLRNLDEKYNGVELTLDAPLPIPAAKSNSFSRSELNLKPVSLEKSNEYNVDSSEPQNDSLEDSRQFKLASEFLDRTSQKDSFELPVVAMDIKPTSISKLDETSRRTVLLDLISNDSSLFLGWYGFRDGQASLQDGVGEFPEQITSVNEGSKALDQVVSRYLDNFEGARAREQIKFGATFVGRYKGGTFVQLFYNEPSQEDTRQHQFGYLVAGAADSDADLLAPLIEHPSDLFAVAAQYFNDGFPLHGKDVSFQFPPTYKPAGLKEEFETLANSASTKQVQPATEADEDDELASWLDEPTDASKKRTSFMDEDPNATAKGNQKNLYDVSTAYFVANGFVLSNDELGDSSEFDVYDDTGGQLRQEIQAPNSDSGIDVTNVNCSQTGLDQNRLREASKRLLAKKAQEAVGLDPGSVVLNLDELDPTQDVKPPSRSDASTTDIEVTPQNKSHIGSSTGSKSNIEKIPLEDLDSLVQGLNKYENVRRIGEGSFGAVYSAYDKILERTVALKVLKVKSKDGEVNKKSEALLDEIRSLTQLNNEPRVVTVYSTGMLEGNIPYMEQEWLAGGSLLTILNEHSLGVESKRAAKIGIAVCEALEKMHPVGMIHRDIKPENLMYREETKTIEDIVLVDFGVASKRKDMRKGWITGTLGYMPPEQAQGETDLVSATADIYSLGATLYHFLTGHSPNKGHSANGWLKNLISEYPDIPSVGAHVDADLTAIVSKAMHADLNKRYQSAQEFKEDLIRYVKGLDVEARQYTLAQTIGRGLKRDWKKKVVGTVAAAAACVGLISGVMYASDRFEVAQRESVAISSMNSAYDKASMANSRLPSRGASVNEIERTINLTNTAIDEARGVSSTYGVDLEDKSNELNALRDGLSIRLTHAKARSSIDDLVEQVSLSFDSLESGASPNQIARVLKQTVEATGVLKSSNNPYALDQIPGLIRNASGLSTRLVDHSAYAGLSVDSQDSDLRTALNFYSTQQASVLQLKTFAGSNNLVLGMETSVNSRLVQLTEFTQRRSDRTQITSHIANNLNRVLEDQNSNLNIILAAYTSELVWLESRNSNFARQIQIDIFDSADSRVRSYLNGNVVTNINSLTPLATMRQVASSTDTLESAARRWDELVESRASRSLLRDVSSVDSMLDSLISRTANLESLTSTANTAFIAANAAYKQNQTGSLQEFIKSLEAASSDEQRTRAVSAYVQTGETDVIALTRIGASTDSAISAYRSLLTADPTNAKGALRLRTLSSRKQELDSLRLGAGNRQVVANHLNRYFTALANNKFGVAFRELNAAQTLSPHSYLSSQLERVRLLESTNRSTRARAVFEHLQAYGTSVRNLYDQYNTDNFRGDEQDLNDELFALRNGRTASRSRTQITGIIQRINTLPADMRESFVTLADSLAQSSKDSSANINRSSIDRLSVIRAHRNRVGEIYRRLNADSTYTRQMYERDHDALSENLRNRLMGRK